MWPVGTIVVCVNSAPATPAFEIGPWPLEKDAYYTIRKSVASFPFKDGTRTGVWLNEVERVNKAGRDRPFAADRFRKAESTHCESTTLVESTKQG